MKSGPPIKLPDFSYERALWDSGLKIIAGADEVGRGAFAGPVVAAVVIFAPMLKIEVEINDSKLLTQKRRKEASIWIKQHAQNFAIGEGSVAEINALGIIPATHLAFTRAIKNLNISIDHLLIDGTRLPKLKPISQTAIIRGDAKSLSIAAASIVAKVYRDDLMIALSEKNENYHWHQNKGYGTFAHREAIKKHGSTPHHRTQFISKLSINPAFSPVQY